MNDSYIDRLFYLWHANYYTSKPEDFIDNMLRYITHVYGIEFDRDHSCRHHGQEVCNFSTTLPYYMFLRATVLKSTADLKLKKQIKELLQDLDLDWEF